MTDRGRFLTVVAIVVIAAMLFVLPAWMASDDRLFPSRADDPTTLLAGASLALDHDLRFDDGDRRRLFAWFPDGAEGLRLASADGWQTLTYDTPIVSALVLSIGASAGPLGATLWHMALLAVALVVAYRYLARFNRRFTSLVAAVGLFVLGPLLTRGLGFGPELGLALLVFTAVAAVGGLVDDDGRQPLALPKLALSAVCLALAVSVQPLVGLVAMPLLHRLRSQRLIWLGLVVTFLVAGAGVHHLILDQTNPVTTRSFHLSDANHSVVETFEASPGALQPPSLMSRLGAVEMPTVVVATDRLASLLWGRLNGLVPRMPVALTALLIGLAVRPVGRNRSLLALALAIAATCVVIAPELTTDARIIVYPLFLFFLTRIPSPALFAPAILIGITTILPALVSKGPTTTTTDGRLNLVRHSPLRLFPLEAESIGDLPGYRGLAFGDLTIHVPNQQAVPKAEAIGFRSQPAGELWLESPHALVDAVFLVAVESEPRLLELRVGDGRTESPLAGEGRNTTIVVRPTAPRIATNNRGVQRFFYELDFRWQESVEPPEVVTLTYVGSTELMATDLFAIDWLSPTVPPAVHAGRWFETITRLVNRSPNAWPTTGSARVKLGYHWLNADGEVVIWEGRRAEISQPVPPGGVVSIRQAVRAPDQPGIYILELDPVFEHVAWFSTRNGGATYRATVEVVQPE